MRTVKRKHHKTEEKTTVSMKMLYMVFLQRKPFFSCQQLFLNATN